MSQTELNFTTNIIVAILGELTSSLSQGPPHIWTHRNTRTAYVEFVGWASHLWAIQTGLHRSFFMRLSSLRDC